MCGDSNGCSARLGQAQRGRILHGPQGSTPWPRGGESSGGSATGFEEVVQTVDVRVGRRFGEAQREVSPHFLQVPALVKSVNSGSIVGGSLDPTSTRP